jgi:hypothetical protein
VFLLFCPTPVCTKCVYCELDSDDDDIITVVVVLDFWTWLYQQLSVCQHNSK